MPGVESVKGTGSSTIGYPTTARTRVVLSPGASPAQFQNVVLQWQHAAHESDSYIDRRLTVRLDTDGAAYCVAVFSPDVSVEQTAGTATFLPALCDAVPAAGVSVVDGEDHRSISLRFPDYATDRTIDLDVLRALPGAESADDQEWEVDGHYY